MCVRPCCTAQVALLRACELIRAASILLFYFDFRRCLCFVRSGILNASIYIHFYVIKVYVIPLGADCVHSGIAPFYF